MNPSAPTNRPHAKDRPPDRAAASASRISGDTPDDDLRALMRILARAIMRGIAP